MKHKIMKGICLHDLKYLLKHTRIKQEEYEKFLQANERSDFW